MRGLPQEITDTIIDLFAPSESERRAAFWPLDRHEADILRACSLTCRALTPRSQKHLFSSIAYDQVPGPKLEGLVSGSPHLIASYVTHFNLVLAGTIDSTLLSRILGLAENLTHLGLYCAHHYTMRWNMWPAVFKNAFYEALQLPSFRSLVVDGCTFEEVLEIESLMSHASNLKELKLSSVTCDDMPARRGNPVSHEALVVLDSLTVTVDPNHRETVNHVVDAMLSSFRMFDIRHLRFLDSNIGALLIPLLKANARTVENVLYCLPKPEYGDPDILKNNTSLRHIDIIRHNADMADSLKIFGNLGHLAALQTLSLHFYDQFGGPRDKMTDEAWAELDRVLAQAGDSLKDVQIYAHTDANNRIPPDLALLHHWLPSVAGKITLYPTNPAED